MRISVDINGYYDWAPVPEGTKISEEDVTALRVKKMTDEKWHMRVKVKCDKPSHHDMGLHEESICQRMAALEKMGRPETREQVTFYMLQTSLRHHLSPSNIVKINVHDDGPNKDVYQAALDAVGVTDQDETMEQYMAPSNMEAYLNTLFKSKSVTPKAGK